MEDFITVFYGNNEITVQNDITFIDLRKEILKKKHRLVKYYFFKGEKINENLSIKNFPTFELSMDKNIFCEFKIGQYRCKRCRRYLRLSKLTCIHSNACRTYFNFKKKESIYEILEGGYYEPNDEESNSIQKEIDEKIKRKEKAEKKKMIERINEILARKDDDHNPFENIEIKII